MILYNVTVNVEKDIHEDWLNWMKTTHIPEVLQTGFFVKHKIFRLLHEAENDGFTYAIQYFLNTLEDLQKYQKEHAPQLQAAHQARYKDKFVAFRTVMEELS